MSEKGYRYIVKFRKHEHPFVVSTFLTSDEYRSLQPASSSVVGWFDRYGDVAWRGECPTCKKLVWATAKNVRGTYSASTDCDERCTSATGYECKCHCAGRNHGHDYAA